MYSFAAFAPVRIYVLVHSTIIYCWGIWRFHIHIFQIMFQLSEKLWTSITQEWSYEKKKLRSWEHIQHSFKEFEIVEQNEISKNGCTLSGECLMYALISTIYTLINV